MAYPRHETAMARPTVITIGQANQMVMHRSNCQLKTSRPATKNADAIDDRIGETGTGLDRGGGPRRPPYGKPDVAGRWVGRHDLKRMRWRLAAPIGVVVRPNGSDQQRRKAATVCRPARYGIRKDYT